MSDDRENKFPSTAHYENGKYVHDPLNQTMAEHEAQGRLGAHDNGQLKHVTAISGYCAAHKRLGCEVCAE